jgi:hypothetical protein
MLYGILHIQEVNACCKAKHIPLVPTTLTTLEVQNLSYVGLTSLALIKHNIRDLCGKSHVGKPSTTVLQECTVIKRQKYLHDLPGIYPFWTKSPFRGKRLTENISVCFHTSNLTAHLD